MSDYLPETCAGCQSGIVPAVGRYYCGRCVVEQVAESRREAQAFDDFHRFADTVARVTR